jgi:hypothetical protein
MSDKVESQMFLTDRGAYLNDEELIESLWFKDQQAFNLIGKERIQETNFIMNYITQRTYLNRFFHTIRFIEKNGSLPIGDYQVA